MGISDYWSEKREKLNNNKDLLKNLDEDKCKIIKKMVIIQIMQIPLNGLEYYLERDKWLCEFAGDSTGISRESINDVDNIKKRDEIIEKEFYKPDLEMLRRIRDSKNKIDSVENYKKEISTLIKELLIPKINAKLNSEDKETVLLLENVYIEPIELLNSYMEKEIGKEVYNTNLLEQWKTANEMAANISAQRNNMNNFYISLMSMLVGGILISDKYIQATTGKISQTILYVFVLLVGTFCCINWIKLINNYKKLNASKFKVINKMERQLPANVMTCEWASVEKEAGNKRKSSFSDKEISIARLFTVVMIVFPIVLLIKTWWEEICTVI